MYKIATVAQIKHCFGLQKRKYLLNDRTSAALKANVKQKSVSTSFLGDNCLYFSAH